MSSYKSTPWRLISGREKPKNIDNPHCQGDLKHFVNEKNFRGWHFHWFFDSLIHCVIDSLIHWFIDSAVQLHMDSCMSFNWHLKKPSLVGGWAYPLKNMSQMGWLFPIYGNNKIHVSNRQPDHIAYSLIHLELYASLLLHLKRLGQAILFFK